MAEKLRSKEKLPRAAPAVCRTAVWDTAVRRTGYFCRALMMVTA